MLNDVLMNGISYVQHLIFEVFGKVRLDDVRLHDMANANDMRDSDGLSKKAPYTLQWPLFAGKVQISKLRYISNLTALFLRYHFSSL